MIKKLFLSSICILLLFSCNNDDDLEEISLEFLPISTVNVPFEVRFGEVFEVQYTYTSPSTCHAFNDLLVTGEVLTPVRTFSLISSVRENNEINNCQPQSEIIERSFTFFANRDPGSSYFFNFWHGTDENGQDMFLTFEIPVIE